MKSSDERINEMIVIIIPQKLLKNPETGDTCSPYGSKLPGYEPFETGKFTWQMVSSSGSLRVGLGRLPADSYEDALKVANNLVEKCGYTLIGESK